MAHALLGRLPLPVHDAPAPAPAPAPVAVGTTLARSGGPPAPPYGSRAGFIPRKPSDFGDGGAYPECHVAQYPLDCGRKGATGGAGAAKSSVVAVTVTEDGSVDYSAIMKQGSNANKVLHAGFNALVPKLHDMTEEVRGARRRGAAARVCVASRVHTGGFAGAVQR
jgi:SNW domain-containing protein 1